MPNPHQPEEVPSLKPCPFCGGKALDDGHMEVMCTNPECGVFLHSAKRWNTRHDLHTDALGAALELLVGQIEDYIRTKSTWMGVNGWVPLTRYKPLAADVEVARVTLEAWKVGK